MPPTLEDVIKFASSIDREGERIQRDEQDLAARRERHEANKRLLAQMIAELSQQPTLAEHFAQRPQLTCTSSPESPTKLFDWRPCPHSAVWEKDGSNSDPFTFVLRFPSSPCSVDVSEGVLLGLGETAFVPPPPVAFESSETSIHGRIKELFERHPYHTFTVPGIIENLRLSSDNEAAVRQAVKRLYEQQRLIKQGRGTYTLNIASQSRVE